MDTLLQDLRYAFRMLTKNPGFTAVAIVTLALGIGANTAIFSVVDGVLLRPAPFADIDRLMMVWETDRNSGTTREPASVPDYLDFQTRSSRFEWFAAFTSAELNLDPEQGDPSRLIALGVSHELFPVLGMTPMVGRAFTPEEDRPNGPAVVMIGEDLWREAFGADPAIGGRTIRLNDQPNTIVGVMPSDAAFGMRQVLGQAAYGRGFADRGGRPRIDLWVPLQADPATLPRSTHPIFVLGRLSPGATTAAAQDEMTRIAADLESQYTDNTARGVFVEPLSQVVFAKVRPALFALWGAVALVLLVACGNVANLMLARGTVRVKEVAVRAALGAGLGRLARQFLVESAVLTGVAAVVGVLLADFGLDLLVALAPSDIPRLSSITLDIRVLVVTLVMTTLVGVVFGVLPTLQARKRNLQTSLKSEAAQGGAAAREHGRLRSTLVVAELALAVTLMVGAGLLIRSLWRLQQVDPGFRTSGVLKAEYQLPRSRYPRDFSVYPRWTAVSQFNDGLRDRVRSLPGVQAVAIAANHPVAAGFTSSVVVVGREAEAADWPEPAIRPVSYEYFDALGVSVIAGRTFTQADGAESAPVAVINIAGAQRYFGDRDPLGSQVRMWGAERTIVGVVANERFHGLAEPTPPGLYYPITQTPSASGAHSLLIRVASDPMAMASSLRSVMRELDPALPLFAVEPLEHTLSASVGQRRFTMLLLGAFAGLALLLAMIGVHGVLSYSVAQRTREIGLRMALGAGVNHVRALVVRQGITLTAAGLILGLAGAFAFTRVLGSLLYEVGTNDPATLLGVLLILGAVALVATWLPVRRATRIEPMAALRDE